MLKVCPLCEKKILDDSRSYRDRLKAWQNANGLPDVTICGECIKRENARAMAAAMSTAMMNIIMKEA